MKRSTSVSLLIFLLLISNVIAQTKSWQNVRLYFTPTFGGKLAAQNTAQAADLATEINNLNSKIGGINAGVTIDAACFGNNSVAIGLAFSTMGNDLRTVQATSGDRNYSYRFETSTLQIPVEYRYNFPPNSKFSLFVPVRIIPSFLIASRLRKNENFFDTNQRYLSSESTDINVAPFTAVNVNMEIGLGLQTKFMGKSSLFIYPSFTYQLRSVWSQTITQNLKMWGVTVGFDLERK